MQTFEKRCKRLKKMAAVTRLPSQCYIRNPVSAGDRGLLNYEFSGDYGRQRPVARLRVRFKRRKSFTAVLKLPADYPYF